MSSSAQFHIFEQGKGKINQDHTDIISETTLLCIMFIQLVTRGRLPEEDSKCTHSSLEIFLMIILTHTFSRHEPKHLLVPRVEKAKSIQS